MALRSLRLVFSEKSDGGRCRMGKTLAGPALSPLLLDHLLLPTRLGQPSFLCPRVRFLHRRQPLLARFFRNPGAPHPLFFLPGNHGLLPQVLLPDILVVLEDQTPPLLQARPKDKLLPPVAAERSLDDNGGLRQRGREGIR